LDQHGVISVEMGNGEEGFGPRRQHGLLLGQILHPSGEDRPFGRDRVAETPDVCLSEGSFPCERLPGDVPGAIAMTLAFGDLRQREGESSCIVEGCHSQVISLRNIVRQGMVPVGEEKRRSKERGPMRACSGIGPDQGIPTVDLSVRTVVKVPACDWSRTAPIGRRTRRSLGATPRCHGWPRRRPIPFVCRLHLDRPGRRAERAGDNPRHQAIEGP
jgi:hypothetical protein